MFGEEVISSFEALGYTYFKVPERDHIEAYMSFGKGYTLGKATAQIYHIHMCPEDHYMWTQLEFRDYLISTPDRAKAYEKLKIDSASRYRNDRGKYMLSKTNFIKETLALAKREEATN